MIFKFNPVLIARVAIANKKAAAYLKRGNVNPDMLSIDTKYLSKAFTWANTPQGYDYWAAINNRLYEIDNLL